MSGAALQWTVLAAQHSTASVTDDIESDQQSKTAAVTFVNCLVNPHVKLSFISTLPTIWIKIYSDLIGFLVISVDFSGCHPVTWAMERGDGLSIQTEMSRPCSLYS